MRSHTSPLLILVGLFCSAASAQIPEVPGKPVEGPSLRFIEIASGLGAKAEPGKEYVVHYTGWLTSGKQFDSSIGRAPLHFVQGRKQVITGWDIGFEGMKVGGKRRLLIPASMGYGAQATGSIPAGSELIFDIELLDVKEPPQVPPAVDVLLPLADLEAKVMALARAIPEDKYGWRPSPGTRSFAEVFLHIGYGNQLLLGIAMNQPSAADLEKQIDVNAKAEKLPLDKAKIVEMLAASFAAVRKPLETARAGQLAHDEEFFGKPTTRRGVFTILDTHIAEHLGQAIAYARMNGIAPPWSEKQLRIR
jgi:FKBP-type peptidyl-prolyl cis-trans isomerase FkpA